MNGISTTIKAAPAICTKNVSHSGSFKVTVEKVTR